MTTPNPSPPQRVEQLPAPPVRPNDGHKGTFGRALIAAGSRGMSGAASLAGWGALRSGVGLVTLCVPDAVLDVVAAAESSYLTRPLATDGEGRFSAAAIEPLTDAISAQNAAAIGPGWGRSADLTLIAARVFETANIPLVVDADALNALAEAADSIGAECRGARILTPHPGEFARLLKSDPHTLGRDREALAVRFARDHQLVLVLKGHRTITTDGERIAVNSTGNSGLATGGSGDVLTGLITGLLAQGMTPFEAAQLGVHLHGLAGDLAAAELSQPGLIASDLPRYIARAWTTLTRSGE